MFFSKLGYYFFVKPISLLPFNLLYVISNILYIGLYKLAGYRKKIVWDNLSQCFPEKSKKDLTLMMNRFYRHFCDLLVESFKLFSINQEEISNRFSFSNPELLNAEYEAGKSVIIVGGHYNNWEFLAVGVDQLMKHQAVGIYKPLSNPFYDKLALSSRSKFGLRMIPMRKVFNFFSNESANLTATIFGSDQAPSNSKKVFWVNFLGRETAVAVGAEKYAKQYNYPIYFGKIDKLKRGHYQFEVIKISDDPSQTQDGEITKKHVELLEQQILDIPDYWLWTHKRWKRVRREEEDLI
jgi:Kdo2-lipid IVA lauroyltransferase/acyltransferase